MVFAFLSRTDDKEALFEFVQADNTRLLKYTRDGIEMITNKECATSPDSSDPGPRFLRFPEPGPVIYPRGWITGFATRDPGPGVLQLLLWTCP